MSLNSVFISFFVLVVNNNYALPANGFLYGYTESVCVACVVADAVQVCVRGGARQRTGGLIVATVMKYADNILSDLRPRGPL